MSTVTKQLPGIGKKHSLPLVLIVALVAFLAFCYVFLGNPSMFGLKAPAHPNNPDLATALNAGQPSIYGKPSLSAKQIDAILAKVGSPAAGTGQALYQGSIASGINDTFALGVFYAESKYGTLGAATANHSLANFTQNGKLVSYPTWSQSYTDFYTRAKAVGQDNPQVVIDALYNVTLNPVDLKGSRAGEPSLQLILSTMRKLAGE